MTLLHYPVIDPLCTKFAEARVCVYMYVSDHKTCSVYKKKKGGKQTSSEWQLTYTEIGVCVVQVHVYSGPELVGLWLLSAELTAASAAGGGEGELFFASSFTGDATGEGDRETFLWCFFSFLDFFFVRSAGLALRLGDFSVFLDLLLKLSWNINIIIEPSQQAHPPGFLE